MNLSSIVSINLLMFLSFIIFIMLLFLIYRVYRLKNILFKTQLKQAKSDNLKKIQYTDRKFFHPLTVENETVFSVNRFPENLKHKKISEYDLKKVSFFRKREL